MCSCCYMPHTARSGPLGRSMPPPRCNGEGATRPRTNRDQCSRVCGCCRTQDAVGHRCLLYLEARGKMGRRHRCSRERPAAVVQNQKGLIHCGTPPRGSPCPSTRPSCVLNRRCSGEVVSLLEQQRHLVQQHPVMPQASHGQMEIEKKPQDCP